MGFCHIAPISQLDLVKDRQEHLTLAHLVEQSAEYANFYYQEAGKGATIIMDNSAFEMYKQGQPMFPSEKLIELGRKCGAKYIALSDYPNQPGSVTIEAAEAYAPMFRAAGFGTFFIPQSRIGDLDDLISTFEWAATSDLVDYIGYSILAIPNAFGVEKDNKLQRFVARTRFVQILKDNTDFFENARTKKHHFLGMVDGPYEIELIKEVFPYNLDTWDSSAAIWAGLNGITFDQSPTGLLNGKFEKEVDFFADGFSMQSVEDAENNMIDIDLTWWSNRLKQKWN